MSKPIIIRYVKLNLFSTESTVFSFSSIQLTIFPLFTKKSPKHLLNTSSLRIQQMQMVSILHRISFFYRIKSLYWHLFNYTTIYKSVYLCFSIFIPYTLYYTCASRIIYSSKYNFFIKVFIQQFFYRCRDSLKALLFTTKKAILLYKIVLSMYN